MLRYSDLEDAFEFNVVGPDEFCTLVHKQTGECLYIADGSPDQYPEDDIESWIELPTKRAVGLGAPLARLFISGCGELEPILFEKVSGGKGFFKRFRSALIEFNLLEKWYDFENEEKRKALMRWASDIGLQVKD